jgi:hypothetical protein
VTTKTNTTAPVQELVTTLQLMVATWDWGRIIAIAIVVFVAIDPEWRNGLGIIFNMVRMFVEVHTVTLLAAGAALYLLRK